MRNLDTWRRDRESANELSRPGIGVISTVNSYFAAIKNSFGSRFVMCGHFDACDDQILTIEAEPVSQSTMWPRQNMLCK